MEEDIMKIADYYSFENQLIKLAEECAKIVVEANQSAIEGRVTDRLIDKMVDVEILIDQVRYLAGIQESDVLETRYCKLKSRIKDIRQ